MAALGDLSYNSLGYIVIFFNDLFTALNGVILKRTTEGKKMHESVLVGHLHELDSPISHRNLHSLLFRLKPKNIKRAI